MATRARFDVDFIEELKLRRWARENYVPTDGRRRDWHPIILEEMDRRDDEFQTGDVSPSDAAVA